MLTVALGVAEEVKMFVHSFTNRAQAPGEHHAAVRKNKTGVHRGAWVA